VTRITRKYASTKNYGSKTVEVGLEMFSGVCWYEFERGDEMVTFPIELTPLQRELLELLEVNPADYA